jgi:hypothetical protein
LVKLGQRTEGGSSLRTRRSRHGEGGGYERCESLNDFATIWIGHLPRWAFVGFICSRLRLFRPDWRKVQILQIHPQILAAPQPIRAARNNPESVDASMHTMAATKQAAK